MRRAAAFVAVLAVTSGLPRQSGTVTAADAAKVAATNPQHRIARAGDNAPPNFADQLEMYDALNTVAPSSLTEADLTRYYKPSTFDVPPDQVLRVESPRPGVQITWDNYGVPHIHGDTREDVAWYGYLNKDLRQVLGRSVSSPYSRTYCGRGSLHRCRVALRASLAGAVGRALAVQGVTSVGELTYDKHQDDIRHVTAGLVGVRPIDWQNRPTFQQVVSFTSHR